MRSRIVGPVLVVSLSLVASASAQNDEIAPSCTLLKKDIPDFAFEPIPPSHCHLEDGCLSVDWNVVNEQQLTEILKIHRITEKTTLKVRTYNVNRLGFVVNWSTKVEQQNQAFETLSGMFDKVFPLLSLVTGTGVAGLEDRSPTSVWLKMVEHAQLCLSETMSTYTDIILDRDGTARRDRLNEIQQIVSKAMPVLSVKRNAVLTALDTSNANSLNTYWKIAERHTDLEKKVAEFLPLARASVEGTETNLGQQKRNSIVTLTGSSAKRSGEAVGEAVTAQYFVATERPLVYHLGYSYGRLKDFSFEQVRTLSGQDLFSATNSSGNQSEASASNSSSGVDVVAFLTWEFLARGPNGRYGAGLTLGTGLTSPGASLYYGGSIRIFTRLFVNGGVVTAKASRGTGEVLESTADGTVRTLFSELVNKSETHPFWSISFKVY